MLRTFFLLLALSGFFLGSADAFPQDTKDVVSLRVDLFDPDGRVMVVAHRACWSAGAPENSLASIARCIAIGADMIEIDIRLTKDGIPVLMHDETIDRTTSGSGKVSDLTYEEISHVRLRRGAGGDKALVSEETVPTLRDVLQLTRGAILINLDVKADAFKAAFEIVRQQDAEDQILMKMGARADDARLINADFIGKTLFMPIIRQCAWLNLTRNCVSRLGESISSYERFNPVAYEIIYRDEDFFREGVPEMQRSGGRIWVNTLSPGHAAGIVDENAVTDPGATWGRIISLGANMIQTDYPGKLIEFLRAKTP